MTATISCNLFTYSQVRLPPLLRLSRVFHMSTGCYIRLWKALCHSSILGYKVRNPGNQWCI